MCIHILCIRAQLCLTVTPGTIARQTGIFHWSELPFPSPGDLPDMSQVSTPCFQGQGRLGRSYPASEVRVAGRSHPPEAKGSDL